jgi:hypothetical protein
VERSLKPKAHQAIEQIKSRLKNDHDGWLSIAERDDIKGVLSSPEEKRKGNLSIVENDDEE